VPFESSLPLVICCLLGAVGGFFVWLQARSRGLLVAATLLALAGMGVFVADLLVETDREYLLEMFPRLARAAERQDISTIMAALDPDLRAADRSSDHER
jgi:hypothetical protein